MLYVPASSRNALATMRKAFGMGDAEAKRSAREYLAQPFYTFVVFHRILHRRERPNDWTVEERNDQDVVQLRESGRPFIVATGHFRRESFLALYTPRICPGNLAGLFAPVAAPSLHPHNIRERVHFGQILKAIQQSRPDLTFVYAGGAVKKLLKHVVQPGSQAIVAADAFWKTTGSSTHTRPFAGMRARSFSVGCAVLSRLAQCPIVACTTYLETDGTVVVEWGRVIAPPQREDEGADSRITDEILDLLEIAVGRQPTQYVLYIGEERRWNSGNQSWEDLS